MNKSIIVYMVGTVLLIGVAALGSVSKYKKELTQNVVAEANQQIQANINQAFQNGVYFGTTAFTKFQGNGINTVTVSNLLQYALAEAIKANSGDTTPIVYPSAAPAEPEVPMVEPVVTDNIEVVE